MNLNQLDLNSLLVLKQLLEEKHVTNTALTLNISQPTVSRSLYKLRKLFDDPLLVRTTTGYELTPKAEFIKQELNKLLGHLDTLINGQDFEAESSKKTVKLFALPPQMETFGTKIVERIRQEAPNMEIDLDCIPKPHFSTLISGDVHFVISPLKPPSSEQDIYMSRLYSQEFRLIMSKKHPLANQELTPENLVECHFGQISLQGDKQLTIEPRFKNLGILDGQKKLSAPIRLNSFSSAAAIAEVTDTIFHLPTNYAKAMCEKHDLIAREVPDALKNQTYLDTYLYWHKRHNNDPMCRWVRSLIKDIASTWVGSTETSLHM